MKSNPSFSLGGNVKLQSDVVGAAASNLCVIHCMVTPAIFAVQATSLSCSEISPTWWSMIDYLFLAITIGAIYFTARSTSSSWVTKVLYVLWSVLALLVINNSLRLLPIPHIILYIPALAMSVLHMYNRKYCLCKEERCCAD